VVPPGSDGSPLQEGNRVLESIARQEAMRALLAFSELHEQIRIRRNPDQDLFETERFILDEVLQLICERAQAISGADGVIVALAERSDTKLPEMVCRAAAGPLPVGRGVRLIGESEFLRDALESGRILRCDDGERDRRVDLDFAHKLGARSTVLVPLRGRREQLGVLQAFSTSARAFTDHNVRCFELFAELVLSALKPEDQDRRIHWLADVADEVLQAKTEADPTETPVDAIALPLAETVPSVESAAAQSGITAEDPTPQNAPVDISSPNQPVILPSAADSTSMVALAENKIEDEQAESAPETPHPSVDALDSNPRTSFSWLARPSLASSRAGLNVVMGMVAVAALFFAGAWWGMQTHGKAGSSSAARNVADANTQVPPRSVTAPPAPLANVSMPVAADNLMSPPKLDSDSASMSPVATDKLAALPKITAVRHWSSSQGSTVVIDMEDQVPYEVHRLMSPERIYFDLHDTVLSPQLDGATMDVGDVSLTRVRVAQPVPGLTRIVLDTRDGSNFSVSMESNPYRLVVELRGTEKAVAVKNNGAKRTTPHPAAASQSLTSANAALLNGKSITAPVSGNAKADVPLAKTGRLRIVLDAGHGGWDLGTVGRQGLLEKDLVLDVTQRLGKLLQTRLGFEVLFTRDKDTYLPLDQRADFANQGQADLFVSVHANYSSSTAARGVETYYSNLFSAPGSREVEKHEDGTSAKLTPVSLSADALHGKIEESRKLAAIVQHSLYATLAANSPGIRNRGIKDSAFVVLTGTTMPAILTEISFVSSPADEQNLQSASYRQQIAEALYQGIARYEKSSPHTQVAHLQTTAARR
jgi:N-acetylmuramoyl-L-alanine amidase